MSLTDHIISRLTFGRRFNDPSPPTAATLNEWLQSQLTAPVADDPIVLQRLAAVRLPITLAAADGTSTSQTLPLTFLFSPADKLWANGQADTTANKAWCHRPAVEVAAARWIRAVFSPSQVQEVMVDFWHNHFSVDAYQSSVISAMWPAYDALLRANALGNFRSMLIATARSACMMYYLNLNSSVASHPNENYAREIMELHTLGIQRYLGETAPANLESGGYSDTDVTNAARALTGWTIADGHQRAADGSRPNTGDFLFSPATHDKQAKTIFGQAYPAGHGEDEGLRLIDALARHPGTAQTIATKLYIRFIQDVPPANDPLVQTLAGLFTRNVDAPNQIALVLQALIGSAEFAAAAGQKVKTPFEYLASVIRATGAEINLQASLDHMLSTMGAPMFQWPTPNGMPDVASAWTGTNDMIRRWTSANQITAPGSGLLADGDGTLFSELALGAKTIPDAAKAVAGAVLGATPGAATSDALLAYAGSSEVLGAHGVFANAKALNTGLRRLVAAAAAAPEFQIR